MPPGHPYHLEQDIWGHGVKAQGRAGLVGAPHIIYLLLLQSLLILVAPHSLVDSDHIL